MRLFVAVDFPRDLRERMLEVTRPVRSKDLPLRWLGVDQLHLTLKFLGEVPRDDLSEARGILEEVASDYRPFDVGFREMGAFPTLRSPRVVWLGVEPVLELRSAKHDLEHAYARMGIERETRAFRPHVTVARVQGRSTTGTLRRLESLAREVTLDEEYRVEEFHLVRSHLRPDGAEYETIHAAPLAREPGEVPRE